MDVNDSAYNHVLSALLNSKHIGIIITDKNDIVTFNNKTACKILGRSFEGKKLPFLHDIKEIVKETTEFEYNVISEGTIKSVKITYAETQSSEVIMTITDISKNIQLQEEILVQKHIAEYNANYDMLTNLPNRRKFTLEIQDFIDQEKDFTLFYLDIDNFKHINDTYGHDIGDRVIKAFAKRLRFVEPEALISRLSGDEFVMLKSGLTVQESVKIAGRIQTQNLNSLEEYDEALENVIIQSSIGIAGFPRDGSTVEDIVTNADYAMFHVKNASKNNFALYNKQMRRARLSKLIMKNDISFSIERDDFIYMYQPQIDSRTGEIVGMEALVRWKHPEKGMLFPDSFIPDAEELGLIVDLDRYLMRKALKDVKILKEEYNYKHQISINLNVQQLNKNFIQFVEKLLKEENCEPDWIKFEITETEIMNEPEKSVQVLNKLKKFGIEILIDDFGTGYSSLAYLVKLPISTLKIDKVFTDTILNDETIIIKTIIKLAENMNLGVIVEGVETEEQVQFLKDRDTYIIQGYYYDKPMLFDDLVKKYFA